jgi:hypothetical protein
VSEHDLLLDAAFLRGDAARAAWDAWRADVDIEAVDGEVHAVLPQAYRNLTGQGFEDPLLTRMAGVYRHAWYANQRVLAAGARAIEALRSVGIDPLVSGGTALALTCYADVGARPLEAADLLVAPREVPRAVAMLERAGWRHTRGRVLGVLRLALRGRTLLRDEAGVPIALRWHRLSAAPATTVEFHATRVRVPSVAIQLADVPPGNELRRRADVLAAASYGLTATRSASISLSSESRVTGNTPVGSNPRSPR